MAAAVRGGRQEEITQEIADLVYVAYGAALAYGIDLDAVIEEVHRANMSKLGDDGQRSSATARRSRALPTQCYAPKEGSTDPDFCAPEDRLLRRRVRSASGY